MTESDPLIYPGLPPFEGYTCPHCGRTGHNARVQYHYERCIDGQHVAVTDGEICDGCGNLVPFDRKETP